MKVAAWQMPIELTVSHEAALDALGRQVRVCEDTGVAILCCPEAAIGGLADDWGERGFTAIRTTDVEARFEVIASESVTVIVGFTELALDGRLYNAAAVVHRGAPAGLYRKRHPAINTSVYTPGSGLPVFHAAGATYQDR